MPVQVSGSFQESLEKSLNSIREHDNVYVVRWDDGEIAGVFWTERLAEQYMDLYPTEVLSLEVVPLQCGDPEKGFWVRNYGGEPKKFETRQEAVDFARKYEYTDEYGTDHRPTVTTKGRVVSVVNHEFSIGY